MKWLILAIFAEISVLLCLIFAFDGAMHSLSSARFTWDHAAVSLLYGAARVHFSWRRTECRVKSSELRTTLNS